MSGATAHPLQTLFFVRPNGRTKYCVASKSLGREGTNRSEGMSTARIVVLIMPSNFFYKGKLFNDEVNI